MYLSIKSKYLLYKTLTCKQHFTVLPDPGGTTLNFFNTLMSALILNMHSTLQACHVIRM